MKARSRIQSADLCTSSIVRRPSVPVSALCLLAAILSSPLNALAGDAATLIFKSGQVILIDNGYRQIVDSMKGLNNTRQEHKIISLDIGGGEFLLNLAEVVSVCRDDCKSMRFIHQLDPARDGEPEVPERRAQ